MARSADSLSIVEARRLACAAQGFGSIDRSSPTTQRHVVDVFTRLGVIQIDSVNVLVRSQELPLFSRLGAHDRAAISQATKKRQVFEYWGHAATHLHIDLHPYFRWKMDAARSGRARHWGLTSFYDENKAFVRRTLKRVTDDGPISARDISTRTTKKGSWWDWDESKTALEYLFLIGEVTAAGRSSDFSRIYDLTERVLPERVLARPTPSEAEAKRELVRRAAVAMGVATSADLADYFRLEHAAAKRAIAELVAEGSLRDVAVEGWKERAYVVKGAKVPASLSASALLSPFDSLVWFRPRNERLFNFHYRIEIYTPEPKRTYGYYVLPFMVNGEIVGRVDLKADRASGTLLVPGVFAEPGANLTKTASLLAKELRVMASWLDLESIEVGRKGNLAASLTKALSARHR